MVGGAEHGGGDGHDLVIEGGYVDDLDAVVKDLGERGSVQSGGLRLRVLEPAEYCMSFLVSGGGGGGKAHSKSSLADAFSI